MNNKRAAELAQRVAIKYLTASGLTEELNLRVLLGSEVLVTIPYLKKLIDVAVNAPGGWGSSSPAAAALERQIKNLSNEYSGVYPYPITELWGILENASVDPDEIALLQAVKTPREKRVKSQPQVRVGDAYWGFSQAVGKIVILRNIDLEKDHHLSPIIKEWQKAILGIKNKYALKAWNRHVKKVMLINAGRLTGRITT